MGSGRVRRLLGGLGLGYLHVVATILVSLWLTPFLLRQLGPQDYGLWLLGAQMVFYLGLMDLGVVALIPREVAGAAGLPAAERLPGIRALVGQATRLAIWQMPAVAAAGAIVLWLLPPDWTQLRGPVAAMVVLFVLAFPLRVLVAVLQGLQDLALVGTIQLVSWAAGTVATVCGMVAGWGLYSLPLGWATTQGVSAVMAWARLRRSFPEVLPRTLPPLAVSAMRQQLGRGVWISVSQVAQVLLSGVDVVVVGKLLGPAAVVPYVCTGRLITMLANQPQMLMQLALPALSELRASAPRARLFDVSRSMTQVMLLGSGAIVAVVLMVNGAFVTWWVGEAQFGGIGLTALMLAGMLLRHLNVTAVYALFCFGNERRLALTAMADGVLGVTAMLLLVPALGLAGAALGSIIATCLVSLPSNLRALAREGGTSPRELLAPLSPWLGRLCALILGLTALLSVWEARGLFGLIAATTITTAAYLLVMAPVLRTPPLAAAMTSAVQPWMVSLPAVLRRWVGQPLTQSQ